VSAKYGAKWPKTLAAAVELIPAYRISGLAAAVPIRHRSIRTVHTERRGGTGALPGPLGLPSASGAASKPPPPTAASVL
jgi:hypothetical protein